MLEDAEPRETPVPVRQPDQEPVQRLQVEHRGQRRHEHRRPNPEPLQRGTLEVPSHRLLAHRHPVLDAARLDVRVHGRRHRLDPEEAVDHAEDRLELLAALEPDHQVGLQHVNLVVLHELAPDPGDLAARVHDQ